MWLHVTSCDVMWLPCLMISGSSVNVCKRQVCGARSTLEFTNVRWVSPSGSKRLVLPCWKPRWPESSSCSSQFLLVVFSCGFRWKYFRMQQIETSRTVLLHWYYYYLKLDLTCFVTGGCSFDLICDDGDSLGPNMPQLWTGSLREELSSSVSSFLCGSVAVWARLWWICASQRYVESQWISQLTC